MSRVVTFMIVAIGWWGTWLGYNLSVERGRHRRKKRGVWDYGRRRERKDLAEEYKRLLGDWGGGLTWTGELRG